MNGWEGVCHVLYVDDDEAASRCVQDALGPGCPLWTVSTLEEARAELDPTIDCVFVAESLPDGSGIEFAERHPELPVILVAEDRSSPLLRQAVRAEVDDVFYKSEYPFSQLDADAEDVVERDADAEDPFSQTTLDAMCDRVAELNREYSSDLRDVALDVAQALLSAVPDEIDTKIEWALQSIGEETDARSCVLYLRQESVLEPEYVWAASASETPDATIALPTAEPVAVSSFPGFENGLDQFQAVHRGLDGFETEEDSSDDIDPQSEIEAVADPEGLLLAIPIIVEWELNGVLAIEFESPTIVDDAAIDPSDEPTPGEAPGASLEAFETAGGYTVDETVRRYLTTVGELILHARRRLHRQQELETTNERLEEFASVLGHDIRSPLTVVEGHVELARETGEVERLDSALEAIDRIEALLDNMLTLATEGAAVGEFELVTLGTVVDRAWSAVDTRGAELHREQLPTIQADPDRLQEAFENLFRNSIEHGVPEPDDGNAVDQSTNGTIAPDDKERPEITVTVEATDDGIAIEDDGQGIPPGQRSKIFERGHTSGEGTGLGLAIVESVVEAHGWTIEVTEGTEGGARFEIITNGYLSSTRRPSGSRT